jgi:hypothetical protein
MTLHRYQALDSPLHAGVQLVCPRFHGSGASGLGLQCVQEPWSVHGPLLHQDVEAARELVRQRPPLLD